MTIKEIAKLAGVSTATVSYSLNDSQQVGEETKKRILKLAQENGYHPNLMAKGLRTNKSNIIGVLVEDVRAFFAPDIINGIMEYTENNGYHLILSDMHFLEKLLNRYEDTVLYKNKINESIALLLSAKVDGIIYIGMHDRDLSGIVNECSKPLVFAYCHTSDDRFASVTNDNEQVSYNVMEFLSKKGHKKIAAITGSDNSLASTQRLNGYKKAIVELNLENNPAYIKHGNWEYDSGYMNTERLMSLKDRPTAIFCFNDYMAIGAMNALMDKKIKVPEDVSVIGFDARDFTEFSRPTLTTVEIPFIKIGQHSAKTMDKLITKKEIKDNCSIVKCSLIERDSVTVRGEA